MAHAYQAVQWNTHKRVYDLTLVAGITLYVGAFVAIGRAVWRDPHAISTPILLIRALGTCAIIMLHIVLCIGPLARFDTLFRPLLYNRRHLGVATFLVGLAHAALAASWYHGFGVLSPAVSMLASNTQFRSISAFPFEILGALALLILFAMAATSHDFWLANLSPRIWKRLHMSVYVAWALLIMHVALGVVQTESSVAYPIALAAGALLVAILHLAAGWRERRRARSLRVADSGDGWLNAGAVDQFRDQSAVTVVLPDQRRAAIFRNGRTLSAISDRCAHQGGPLGEGRIVNGCVTCPWHGYQYRPEDGQSPPPYTERLPTYRLRIDGGYVFIEAVAQPSGTRVEPVTLSEAPDE